MEFNLKPGTYYIGDPSYVTKGNEGWQWLEGIWKELYASVDKCIFTTFEGVELFRLSILIIDIAPLSTKKSPNIPSPP